MKSNDNTSSYYLSKTTASYNGLTANRTSVTTLSQLEISTLLGDRYSAQAIFTLGDSEVNYLQFTMPSVEDGVVAIFTLRDINADDGVYFNLYLDPVGVVKGSAVNIFNENQRKIKTSNMDYTFVTGTPSNLGILRESSKSATISTGVAKKTLPSQIGAAQGYRVYDEGRQVLLEIENLGDSGNEVILTYSWVEAPATLFN